jgi:hypothetical protein
LRGRISQPDADEENLVPARELVHVITLTWPRHNESLIVVGPIVVTANHPHQKLDGKSTTAAMSAATPVRRRPMIARLL